MAAKQCESKESTGVIYTELYGRRICKSCGNAVLPNSDGALRAHKAINYFAKYGHLLTAK